MRAAPQGFVAALLLATGAMAGCAEKTDCQKMRQRMTECSVVLWDTLEPKLRGRIPPAWHRDKIQRHYRYCKRIKGVYKQSGKINKCLELEDCAEFAQCFCRAVKSPKECGSQR